MNSKSKIIQVPLKGGSASVITGAIQFQDDWPGLFVRGDDCLRLVLEMRLLQEWLGATNKLPSTLQRIAQLIEQDVIVQR